MGAYISRLMGADTSKLVGAAATAFITVLVEYFLRKWIKRNQSIFYQIQEAEPVSDDDWRYRTNRIVYVEGVSPAPSFQVPKPATTMTKLWSWLLCGRWPDTVPLEKLERISLQLKPEGRLLGNDARNFHFKNPSKATFVMRGLLWTAVQGNKEKAAFDLTCSKTRLVGYGVVTASTKNDIYFNPPENSKGWYILANMSRGELRASFRNKILLSLGLAFVIFLIGGGVTVYLIYRHRKSSYRERRGDDTASDEQRD